MQAISVVPRCCRDNPWLSANSDRPRSFKHESIRNNGSGLFAGKQEVTRKYRCKNNINIKKGFRVDTLQYTLYTSKVYGHRHIFWLGLFPIPMCCLVIFLLIKKKLVFNPLQPNVFHWLPFIDTDQSQQKHLNAF